MKKILLLLLLFVSQLEAITRTVCPSGCDFTTVQAAYNACVDGDVVELRANITENVNLDRPVNVTVTADTPRGRTITATGGSSSNGTFEITSAMTKTATVKNLYIDKTGGGAATIAIASTAAGQVFKLVNCMVRSSAAGSEVFRNDAGNLQAGNILVQQCDFVASATGSLCFEDGTNTTSLSVRFENSTFRGGTGTVATIGMNTSSANTVNELYFCDILANTGTGPGIDLATRAIIKDCIFANNTDDVLLSGSGTSADFTYSAFEQDLVIGILATNITITSTNEFVNESINDYHLNSGAICRGAGITVSGITVDHDNVVRSGSPDIGAFEFVAAGGTATATNTATNTATQTATATATSTATQTATATFTATATNTATQTATATATQTATATATATSTATATFTATATNTATQTATATATNSATITVTATVTVTATITPVIDLRRGHRTG